MTGKLLVIVDMQNDFISGSLANPDAADIIPNIVQLIQEWDDKILLTQDTHDASYYATQEGKNLPVKHCIEPHAGWCICDAILDALDEKRPDDIAFIRKQTFGAINIRSEIDGRFGSAPPEEIVICGTCTDICVISNALILRASYPNTPISCRIDCCAASGTTPELRKVKQNAAIDILTSCHIAVSQIVKKEIQSSLTKYK